MLEKLILWNFQSHRKLEVELDPRINCFIGDNDVGKSAVLRALKWIMLNAVSGERFISWGAEFAKGVLILDGGRKLIRKKGSGENLYRLDGKEFKALGAAGVPDEVAKLLNVAEINFQNQLEPPFWFFSTPGQVSRELNAIVDLSVIDESLSKVATEARRARSESEVCQKRLTEARRVKKTLDWVPEFVADLDRVTIKEKAWTDSIPRHRKISAIFREVFAIQTALRIAKETAEGLENAVSFGKRCRAASEKKTKLSGLIQEIKRLSQLTREQPDINNLVKIKEKLDGISSERKSLRMTTEIIRKLEAEESCARETERKIRAKIRKKSGGKCPVCGQTLRQ